MSLWLFSFGTIAIARCDRLAADTGGCVPTMRLVGLLATLWALCTACELVRWVRRGRFRSGRWWPPPMIVRAKRLIGLHHSDEEEVEHQAPAGAFSPAERDSMM